MSLFAFFKKSSNKVGAILAGIYVISQASIALLLGHRVGSDLVPMQLSFTQTRFEGIVSQWTAQDVAQFQHHFYLDFIHPFWYAGLLAWALAKTLSDSWRVLVWMPVVAGLCDLGENTIHAMHVLDGTFVDLGQPAIAISSSLAAVKWGLALMSIIAIVSGFFQSRARH